MFFESFLYVYNEYSVLNSYVVKKILDHLNMTRYGPCPIGVARIFDWGAGGANHKSHAMISSKIFKGGTFCGAQRYRKVEDEKSRPGFST